MQVLLLAALVAHVYAQSSNSNPSACIASQTSMLDLAKCFEPFIKSPNTINASFFDTYINPKPEERAAWIYVVQQLLNLPPNSPCPVLETMPNVNALVQKYQISEFPKSGASKFCVLYEPQTTTVRNQQGQMITQFMRGWGWFAVPKVTKRHVHLSAAHPQFDGDVHHQASGVFEEVGGKSLLITGSNRLSYDKWSVCQNGERNPVFRNARVTDPSHENSTLFQAAAIEIKNWQINPAAGRSCDPHTCAFIQFHGKAADACPDATAFMSAGIADKQWYINNQNTALARLFAAMQYEHMASGTTWNVATPASSTCDLTAGPNVFGRYVNGVSATSVCNTAADASNVMGRFIHIEQSPVARVVPVWAAAVSRAFATV